MGRTLGVFLDLGESPVLVGTAFFHGFGKRLSTSFSYATDWLATAHAFPLSPTATLQARTFQFKGLPGFLSDAAPDQWGRHLIFRGAQDRARRDGVPIPSLDDVDYLLGVDDWSRMGALRFSVDGGRTFLGNRTDIPKIVRLPELAGAARNVTAGTDGWHEVKSLLDAGTSSLGGARPKATVTDGVALLLAKFPSAHDEWDIISWEAWAQAMATRCGLNAPRHRLENLGTYSVLLEERFDRNGNTRIHYLSALSALDLTDGAESDYTELADVLLTLSGRPRDDLLELLGRMVLSVALHNTDDHLRNHGFVKCGRTWRLAPVFDVNPNPLAAERRALGIFGETGINETAGLAEFARLFDASSDEYAHIISRTLTAFRPWKAIAERLGCKPRDIALFEPVIEERLCSLQNDSPRA